MQDNPLNKRLFRILLMLIDHFAMCIVGMIIMIPAYIILIIINGVDALTGGLWEITFVFSLVYAVYFNKDTFAGRGIAKRALKYQTIYIKTGKVANPYRCLARNLTIIIWPIEFIIALISPARRIGDFIAGTKIQPIEISQERKTQWHEIIICLFLAYLFSLIITSSYLLVGNQGQSFFVICQLKTILKYSFIKFT